jgi:nitrate reductase NapA
MPDAEYPFWLCTGRVLEHWHTGTMTMRVPQLRRAMPNAYVEMNRDDARARRRERRPCASSRARGIELPVWIDGRGSPPRARCSCRSSTSGCSSTS